MSTWKKRGGVNEKYIEYERGKQRVHMSGAAARTGGLIIINEKKVMDNEEVNIWGTNKCDWN